MRATTPGGSALWQHADDNTYGPSTSELISKKWNFVVLQDQSQSPGSGAVTSGSALPVGECKKRAESALHDFFVPRCHNVSQASRCPLTGGSMRTSRVYLGQQC
jgi:hypothetical protein